MSKKRSKLSMPPARPSVPASDPAMAIVMMMVCSFGLNGPGKRRRRTRRRRTRRRRRRRNEEEEEEEEEEKW